MWKNESHIQDINTEEDIKKIERKLKSDEKKSLKKGDKLCT